MNISDCVVISTLSSVLLGDSILDFENTSVKKNYIQPMLKCIIIIISGIPYVGMLGQLASTNCPSCYKF